MQSFPDVLIRDLAKTTGYRQFLLAIFHFMEKERGRGFQAQVSRNAGFASRSYLTEVLKGKKGLSRDSMIRLKSALKISGPVSKYFEYLVYSDLPQLQTKPLSAEELRKRVSTLRKELSRYRRHSDTLAKPHLRRPEVFQIYAALGAEEIGATTSEIMLKTGLSEKAVTQGLGDLLSAKAVSSAQNKFFAVQSKADAIGGHEAGAVAEMVQKVCGNIKKRAQQMAADEKSLNVYSAFSVRREKALELKAKLEKALFEVLDEYQDDEGECVEQVFLSLFTSQSINA
jgi:uncharacterized protein (TIGR02147 family)